ncbi:MAG: hypothetical protein COA69_03440 [Robiginitomaculum sp.]|nr:MAG: hypothetical protein COA69_03440 [Robiginitomaculum sp.]
MVKTTPLKPDAKKQSASKSTGLKKLRNITRNIPPLTSNFAFSVMAVGLVVFALRFLLEIVVGGTGMALTPLSLIGLIWQLLGITLGLSAVFAVICASYLTLTANWDLFIIWLLDWRARRKDGLQAVTTNFRIVRKLFPSSKDNGFLLTMAPAMQFPNKDAEKITFDDDRHVTLVANSRAGKGTGFIIPNLLHHKGSTIVYDPSGENFAATAAFRQQVLGQRIILLDPMQVTGMASDTWNPMSEIDFDNDPFAIDKCYMFAESIQFDKSSDPYWTDAARKLLAMTIAYVGARSILEHNHLGTVRDLLMGSELSALWNAMTACEAYGGIVRRFGEANESRPEKELGSVIETVRTALKFLDSEVMTNFVRVSNFDMRELKKDDVSVYIVLPAGLGESYKPWIRLLFNAAFDAAQDLSIPKPKHSTLFVMDEFPLLGQMERIKRAAGEAAKFGVKLFIIAQDISQLKEHYGVAWETFIANSGVLIMFANNDLETQNYISARLGKKLTQKLSYSSSNGRGGKSTSKSSSLELEDVARADQLEKSSSRQSGSAFIFIAGSKPMRLPRATYYDWDMVPKGLKYKPASKPKSKYAASQIAAE